MNDHPSKPIREAVRLYEFALILSPGTELTEGLAEGLFEAGCTVARVQIDAETLAERAN